MGILHSCIFWLWWMSLIFLLLRPARTELDPRIIYSDLKMLFSNLTESHRDKEEGTKATATAVTNEIVVTPDEPLPEVRPKSAQELGIPQCESSVNDCAYGGLCAKAENGNRTCLCPASCPPIIPVTCGTGKDVGYHCLSMSDEYRQRYDLPKPTCHARVCVCPPSFERSYIQVSEDEEIIEPRRSLLPLKCDRRELQAEAWFQPANVVYSGTDISLNCCINIDPRAFVIYNDVNFIQNLTIVREPSYTPYKERFVDGYEPFRCWSLVIPNAQFSDSGTYLCQVNTKISGISANATVELFVKARPPQMLTRIQRRRTASTPSSAVNATRPSRVEKVGSSEPVGDRNESTAVVSQRAELKGKIPMTAVPSQSPKMIQNVTVKANQTEAQVFWSSQEEPPLPQINVKLMKRGERIKIFHQEDAKPGFIIGNLDPGTAYTLFFEIAHVHQSVPFLITEHFTTADAQPDPPIALDLRTVNNRGVLNCEIEWKHPKRPRGTILKYYVRMRGVVRYVAPGGALSNDDYPEGNTCRNYDGDPQKFTETAIGDIFSCRFGPLKPNRNYTATLWAENRAGRSEPEEFETSCITDFAEPDAVDPPSSLPQNGTSFGLSFGVEPDETNGPVACYYVAIVPLPTDTAIEDLPAPESMVFDSFARAVTNNVPDRKEPNANIHYFAYIAESYMEYPRQTIIGDWNTSSGTACNVFYLSRHKPQDPALRSGLKYTGFLIARVDRDKNLRSMEREMAIFKRSNRYSEMFRPVHPYVYLPDRVTRQLIDNGPAYGFSGFFKPIILEADDFTSQQSLVTVLFIVLSLLAFFIFASSTAVYFMHRNGMISELCPLKQKRIALKPSLLAVRVEDLPHEFVMRHRDSNFLFISEFESLPHYHQTQQALASEKRENSHKNRYNDIKAFDATRVKLSQLNSDVDSDYINANFIKGYKGRKTFIATQGPVDATVDDFWRMVWEHKVHVIVMVANLFERSRSQCSKYWPDDVPKMYDRLEVRPVDSTYYSDYAVRSFEIRRVRKTVANGSVTGHPAIISYETVDANGAAVDPTTVTVNTSRTTSAHASVDSNLDSDYANVVHVNGDSKRGSKSSNNLRLSCNLLETDFGGKSPDVRRVVQYHYTSWNDLQAPECTTGLLRFLSKLRKLEDFNKSPVVVHCSAGVGRTGTFIAIDSLLDQCIEEGKADVFGFVSEMRKQRNIMVQNYEQYVFVYKALAEWYMFGETDVEVDMFHEHYRMLKEPHRERQPSANSGIISVFKSTPRISRANGDINLEKQTTGLEEEFKRLDNVLELNRTTHFAHKPENAAKNRFDNAVPYDQCRVVLSIMLGSVADTTYINASLFKGYFYPYILAQDPVDEHTCYDFWRMIGDQNSKAVVMLSNHDEFLPKEKYWPEEIGKSVSFGRDGDVSVKLVNEEVFASFVLRKLTYKFAKEKMYREIVQFDYICWPKGAVVPSSTESMIDLISRVLSLQSNYQESGPIILHSRDGSSETGLFCGVSLLLERLKAENRVDVFQTVRSLQQNRPLMFRKLEQYEFCYRAVIDYLESFNDRSASR